MSVQKWTPKSLYRFWNCRYFRSALPDIPVTWSDKQFKGNRRTKMGSTWLAEETGRPIRIALNPKYRGAFVIWAQTLLHEMVHVQQWRTPAEQMHGRKFQKRMKQLAAAGAFNRLW